MKYSEFEHKRRRRERNRAIASAILIVVIGWAVITLAIVLFDDRPMAMMSHLR